MSSRNRPRANHNQATDEERRLWDQIRAEAAKADVMIKRQAAIGPEIVEIEQQQKELLDADKPSDAALDDRLESLYRENVRLSEQISHIIEGKSDDMNLLDSIKVLQGLREASEESSQQASSQPPSRGTGPLKRSGTGIAKRKGPGSNNISSNDGATDAGEEASAAPSPRVSIGPGSRLGIGPGGRKEQSQVRGSSAAPSTREASVKIEDGAESVASSVEGGTKAPSSSSDPSRSRLTLSVGAMVYYRNKGRAQEGEGILCRVTSVIGEGKQRRYEIQDADPDPAPGTGEMPAPYRASVSHLVPISTTNNGLPDLGKGRNVLAQYPDTTTFYKAEVSTTWRAKDLGIDRGELVRLRFEGEMEEAKETEVERRFVLPDR